MTLKTAGLRHAALFVEDLDAARQFYCDLLGMTVEWHPDADNLYLTSGNDNLALHRRTTPLGEGQRLDHLGFIIDQADDVNRWHQRLMDAGVTIVAEPRDHRDGARSFYCHDPDGTLIQLIFHPPLARGTATD